MTDNKQKKVIQSFHKGHRYVKRIWLEAGKNYPKIGLPLPILTTWGRWNCSNCWKNAFFFSWWADLETKFHVNVCSVCVTVCWEICQYFSFVSLLIMQAQGIHQHQLYHYLHEKYFSRLDYLYHACIFVA